jgi:hypothetical protein
VNPVVFYLGLKVSPEISDLFNRTLFAASAHKSSIL